MILNVLIGWLIHLSVKILAAIGKHKTGFSVSIWFKQPRNYIYLISTLLTAWGLIRSITIAPNTTIDFSIITFDVGLIVALVIGLVPTVILNMIIKKVIPNYKKEDK